MPHLNSWMDFFNPEKNLSKSVTDFFRWEKVVIWNNLWKAGQITYYFFVCYRKVLLIPILCIPSFKCNCSFLDTPVFLVSLYWTKLFFFFFRLPDDVLMVKLIAKIILKLNNPCYRNARSTRKQECAFFLPRQNRFCNKKVINSWFFFWIFALISI